MKIKIIIMLAWLFLAPSAYPATRQDIQHALKDFQEQCTIGSVFLNPKSGGSFASVHTVECSHFTVSLITSIYLDSGYDTEMANMELSRRYDGKTISDILEQPPANSLYKRYEAITHGKKVDYVDGHTYTELMGYIQDQRLPYSALTIEDLKRLDEKQGLMISQIVEINFNNLDSAVEFLEHVAEAYYKIPMPELAVSYYRQPAP